MPPTHTHRKEDDMADPVTAHDTISTAQLAATVELACRAPSLHNSQPWRWSSTPALCTYSPTTPELVVTPTAPGGK